MPGTTGTTLGTAYVQIVPSARGIKGSISNVLGGEAKSAGTSAGASIASFAKKAIAAAGIGTALVIGLKASLGEGAKLQQSYLGGVDTLYGEAADGVRKYAKEAAKAGISMNDYSEQAVSFGAALKQAYGGDTTKAMEAANTAILDMTDNAAKMGTPLESIQNAYQGFAKQNYTMLDNLKLGYGGTKTEMERLLKDAQALTGVEYNIDNLGDVYEAIHVIQGDLGLTGVAAEEAAQTFSGSLGAMKAANKNFFGSLALGEDVRPALNTLLSSINTFVFNNLIPMIGNVAKGIPDIIAAFVTQAIPMLITKLITGIKTLASGLSSAADGLTAEKVQAWATTTGADLLKRGAELIGRLAKALIDNLPKIASAIGQIALSIVTGLGSAIWPKITAAATGIKDRFLTVLRGLWDGVKETAENIRAGFMGKVEAIRDSIKAVAESIKSKFLAPIEALRDRISGIVEAIKSFFSFDISAPHIPLPHFSVSPSGWKLGDLLKGQIPSLGVEWYAKGGIATGPTVAGIGEGRSDEAILPLDPFWRKMDKLIDATEGRSGDINVNVYGAPGMDINQLADAVQQRIIQLQKRRSAAWSRV